MKTDFTVAEDLHRRTNASVSVESREEKRGTSAVSPYKRNIFHSLLYLFIDFLIRFLLQILVTERTYARNLEVVTVITAR